MHGENNSPWLEQVVRSSPAKTLTKDATADVAIIGAGIAGAATAYFTLRDTNATVIVLEASVIAGGATGHNAGQVVSYFERPLADIITEFGEAQAMQGLADVESGWDLLETIYSETGLTAPLTQFTGYGGCTTVKQVLRHLKNNQLRRVAQLPTGVTLVTEAVAAALPADVMDQVTVVPHREILDLLETNNTRYIAALGSRKGCLNSALFTHQLFEYMRAKYPHRLQVFEHTPVQTLRLHATHVDCISAPHAVVAKKVVLCTNGFETLDIHNSGGVDINTEFHHMVKGSVGYMAAYRAATAKGPMAVSYFPLEESDEARETVDAAPYYYLTRRLHYTGTTDEPELICIGGPEQVLDDTRAYRKSHRVPDEATKGIRDFLTTSYRHAPPKEKPYAFVWHGLMGYTPNGIRRVGPEPHNPRLLYNLGCNGIGILPSIFAGARIAKILRGDSLPPSIFDVPKNH